MANTQLLDWSILLWSDVSANQIYSKIINFDIVPAPQDNNLYQKDFFYDNDDFPDRFLAYLRTRRGLTEALTVRWDSTAEEYLYIDLTTRNITDEQVIDWARYFFAVNENKTRMKILKQEAEHEIWDCWWIVSSRYNDWVILDITNNDGLDYFPFSECTYDKFVQAVWPSGRVISEGDNGHIRNEIKWAEVFTYFSDDDQIMVWSLWNFVFLYDWPFSTQALWISASEGNDFLMEWPFAWFSNVSLNINSSSLWQSIEEVANWLRPSFEKSPRHKRKVFSDRWLIPYFATSDGIYMLNYSWTKPEETTSTYDGNTKWWSFIISWMLNINDSILFYDSKNNRLYHGLRGYQKTYFDPRNSIEVDQTFFSMWELSWYPVMIWPHSIKMYNPTFISWNQIDFRWWLNISEAVWVFWARSWSIDQWVLNRVGEDKLLRATILEVYWETNIVPKTEQVPCSYQTDINSCNRLEDTISILNTWRSLEIILSNGVGSIALVRDFFWRKNIYQNNVILGWDRKNYYGKWMFFRGGTKDIEDPIKTVLERSVWDQDHKFIKQITSAKISFWYNSSITKGNTSIHIESASGNAKTIIDLKDLTTVNWVHLLMKAKDGSNRIIKDSSWFETINNDNWHWLTKNDKNLSAELASFASMSYWPTDDSNYKTEKYLPKSVSAEFPLSLFSEVLRLSIISENWDLCETGGISILFEPMDINTSEFTNVHTVSFPNRGMVLNK